jgi:hypothetical protein
MEKKTKKKPSSDSDQCTAEVFPRRETHVYQTSVTFTFLIRTNRRKSCSSQQQHNPREAIALMELKCQASSVDTAKG